MFIKEFPGKLCYVWGAFRLSEFSFVEHTDRIPLNPYWLGFGVAASDADLSGNQ
jgi:hypothetical protein